MVAVSVVAPRGVSKSEATSAANQPVDARFAMQARNSMQDGGRGLDGNDAPGRTGNIMCLHGYGPWHRHAVTGQQPRPTLLLTQPVLCGSYTRTDFENCRSRSDGRAPRVDLGVSSPSSPARIICWMASCDRNVTTARHPQRRFLLRWLCPFGSRTATSAFASSASNERALGTPLKGSKARPQLPPTASLHRRRLSELFG